MPAKKLLILDLDNTLWNGTLDEGPAVFCDTTVTGEAFYRFQEFLKTLASEGARLALCSRNDRSLVEANFAKMKMPLSIGDFAATRIDYHSKVADVESIATELGAAPDETIFIGENAALLAEVAAANPGVECLPTPPDDDGWAQLFALLQSRFARWSLSREEELRTDPLRSESEVHTKFGHLLPLRLRIDIDETGRHNIPIHDLLNTTNQFNLTGERISEDEWKAMPPETFCYSASLCDRYGDFGPVCAILGRRSAPGVVAIDNLALSGRAFGYGIEFVLLNHLCDKSVREVVGRWTDTGRNTAALEFLQTLQATICDDGAWSVDADIVRRINAEFLEQSRADVSARVAVA